MFDTVQLKFYQPSVIKRIDERLKNVYAYFIEYSKSTFSVLMPFYENPSLRACVTIDQNENDIWELQRQIVALRNKIEGFLGVRVVGVDGKKIHYSTFFEDTFHSDIEHISYRNYSVASNLLYENVASLQGSEPRIVFDFINDRFVFSFPFYDNYEIYHGSLLIYVSVSDFAKSVSAAGYSSIVDSVHLLFFTSNTDGVTIQGILFNANDTGLSATLNAVTNLWRKGITTHAGISDGRGGENLLFSYTQGNYFIGVLYDSSVFEIDSPTRISMVFAIYLCIFLMFFLIVNFRRNPLLKLKTEILNLQTEIVREFFNNINKINWEILAKEIRYRKHDVISHVKRSLSKTQLKLYGTEIYDFIDASWETLAEMLENSAPKPVTPAKKLAPPEVIEDIDLSLVPGSALFKKTQFNVKKINAAISDEFDEDSEITEVESVSIFDESTEDDIDISAAPVILFDSGYKGIDEEIILPGKEEEPATMDGEAAEDDVVDSDDDDGMGLNLENLDREKYTHFAAFFADLDKKQTVDNPFLTDDIVPSIVNSLLVDNDTKSATTEAVAADGATGENPQMNFSQKREM